MKKEAMKMKDSKEDYLQEFGRRKGKGEIT